MFRVSPRPALAVFFAALFFLVVPSFAATFSFAGPDPTDPNPGNPTDWFNAKNWRPNGVPGAADIAEIPSGTADIGSRTVAVQSLILSGTLTGAREGRLTINGASNWTGGVLQNVTLAVPTNITLNISGANSKLLDGAVLANSGLVIWSGPASLSGGNDALIINNVTGVFSLRADGTPFVFNNSGAQPTFTNVAGATPLTGGILRKEQSNGTTTMSGWKFNVGNTVDVKSGVLEFNASLSLANGSGFTGAGRTRFVGGLNLLSGSVEAATTTVEIAGGSLRSANPAGLFRPLITSGNGVFEWTGGSLSGFLSLERRSVMNISGASALSRKVLIGATFNNNGTINWNDGPITATTSAIVSNLAAGTFNARKPGLSVQDSSTNPVFIFNNFGTFNLPGAATSGIAPTPGAINFTGRFAQATNGVVRVGILNDGANGFDQLNVSGAVTLDGALTADLLPNAPLPAPGASFKVLTYGSRSGEFARVNAPFVPIYNANDLTLTIPANAPSLFVEPSLPQVSEGGQTFLTVFRNGSTAQALTVSVSSDNPQVSVPTTVTIPAGAILASITATINDNGVAEEPELATITASAAGLNSGAATITIVDNSAQLTLSITPTTFSESVGIGAATGTITRNTVTTSSLRVALVNSNPNRISLPAEITIPAGQASATFFIATINNQTADGNAVARITANAAGLPSSNTVTLNITDDDRGGLSVTNNAPSSTLPEGASATGTITRNNADLNSSLTVSLSSQNSRLLSVPSSVTIAPGRTSATFPIQAPENTTIDGDLFLTLTARASGFTDGSSLVKVVDNDAPRITSFSPTSGPAGTTVVITGTNLNTAQRVFFSGASATFTINSPTQITTTVPANAVTGRIRIETTPSTASVNSATDFTVTSTAITSFTPLRGVTGTTVTINGANFSGATSVTLNGVNAASFAVVSPTQITAVVPATATSGKISVTAPAGRATSNFNFSVVPTITSFSPTSGIPPQSVVITGSGFSGATSVRFNGVSAAFTVNSASQITATLPAAATTGPITVNTLGASATSAANFVVNPGIKEFTPDSGTAGTRVEIRGWGLSGATSVRFNGVAATFTVNSVNKITATVPNGATTGPISITTPNGSVTSTQNFVVCASKVTAQVRITRGALVPVDSLPFHNTYEQTVTLRNVGAQALNGPITLVLDDLSKSATLTNASGFTVCAAPLNSPYIEVNAGSDNVFSVGETLTVTLRFESPTSTIDYTPRVLAGSNYR